jgi:Mg-chelatase subunit ChlD
MKNNTADKKSTTDIVIVLDRSGSMEAIRQATISGFNAFLKEQQSVEEEAKITLVQFDHLYERLYVRLDIREARPLNKHTYIPRGTTALLDAMGRTIKDTRKHIEALPEGEKPGRVIFVTITDGHENRSSKYTRKQVFDKVSKMQEKHGWEFLFLGANQDAIEEASQLGIEANKAINFVADDEGAGLMFCFMSNKIANSRKSGSEVSFSDDEEELKAN